MEKDLTEKLSDHEKDLIADKIVRETLLIVAEKNGTGEEGESGKKYHNMKHAQFVLTDTLALIELAIRNGRKVKRYLGKIAAVKHDEEQNLGRGDNEVASAESAKRRMVEAGFPDDEISEVVDAIWGTRVTFDVDGMRQYPNEENYLSLILADADLANLGGPTEFFLESTRDVMLELNDGKLPDLEKQIEFWESNIKLLSTHEYYTDEAKAMFNNQPANLAKSMEILEELKNKR